jgi:DNA polymerase-3 subunit epsilon
VHVGLQVVGATRYKVWMSDVLTQPLSSTEFLVVDVETNGKAGDECELTELGAVLVGGGELHDRWETLVGVRAPLSRMIQRFTGISQAMVDEAPAVELVLPDLAEQLEGRVLVGHNIAFDRRVLRQAFARADLAWPDVPTLCTVALARRFAPLARRRGLKPLAEALGIEVEIAHRALADAETCARVLCALLPRLVVHAGTVGDAVELLKAAARRPRRPRAGRTIARQGRAEHRVDVSGLPDEPGVYLFRNAGGQVLYIGKSVSLRARARSHFQPSSASQGWVAQATMVDHRTTSSELGALVLEQRLIKEMRPPGNVRMKHDDPYVYLRSVTIGPLRGRRAAIELMEQLNSLFTLRHCGRALRLREHPSAYGQMGRCLSPCLNDLDPNLYRRRLDEALALFTGDGDGGAALLAHVESEMRQASVEQRYERAAWLRRRLRRLRELTADLAGLQAIHARPRLVVAPHPRASRPRSGVRSRRRAARRVRRFGDARSRCLTPDSPLSSKSHLNSCEIYCTVLQTLGHGRPASRFFKRREGG